MNPPASGPQCAPVRRQLLSLILTTTLLLSGFIFKSPLVVQTVYADTGLGSISLTNPGTAYTQNFDTLSNTAGSTTNTTLPTGWYITETGGGARDNEQYGVDTGSSTTGDIYSYGTAGATDRALGALRSGTLVPLFGAKFTNNTGATITSLDVAYNGEEWRLGTAARTDQINFEYSTNATDLSTGTWTGVSALNFVTPDTTTVGAKNGNAAGERAALSTTVSSLNIPNGASFFIRWTDTDASGSDDGLAVDDFSIKPGGTVVTNNPPSINAPANPIATVTQGSAPFNVSLSGTDDNNVFNWSATPGTGVSSVVVNSGQGTGNITYTVTLQSGFNGTATFTASLSDNVNAAVTRSVNIQVNPLVVNNPPTINAPANPIITVAQDAAPFNVSLTGADDNNVFNWSATAGTGVSNVAVTAGQGTSSVTYTVTLTPGFSGTASFTARLSDNVNPVVTQAVNINVTPAPSTAGTVVISQVYGGGGNTGSTLTNDYIELINHSFAPVNLNGWSVQAFVTPQGGGAGSWQVTPLTNFTLQPGQYYLIQESQGIGGTTGLPTPDATGTIAVSSTSTKVALVSNTTTITGVCPTAGVVDLVGYGAADCYEGSGPAPLLTNTTAAFRLNEGCFDTDDNANDFVSGAPNPHNSSSATHDCTGISGFGSASPSTVLQGSSTTLTVHVAAGQNPASTGVHVVANLSSIGGSATQSFSGAGNTFTFTALVPTDNAPGLKSLPVTISDAQGRSFSTDIKLSILPVVPDHIVISQIYGGGGNASATFNNDYVELYNPTDSTVTITGWTLQYASAAGTVWTNKQPLGGIIGSHQYYLVKLASGGANGAQLPDTPNISGDINMSATTGKIALVKNSDSLTGGGCPIGTDPDIVDFVGYGTASCHEGDANAPAPSNTRALFRKNGGDTDTNQNGADFITGTPNPRRTEPVVELGPWVAGTDPTTDDNTIPHDASVTVNFSEPVDVDPGWYNITCSVTGSHNDATVAHTSDLKTYAITPNTNFQFGEQCTITVPKTAIHDHDSDDSGPDTDSLFADYTWSFTVVGAGQPAPYAPGVHLTMGNPTNAVADVSQPLNYLMMKPTYAVSYNRDKGTPNWVSWHLDNSWYGTLARVDTFRPDPAVPADWYRVQAFDFAGTGFDRGHMTPNADRDNQNRVPINQETYLMSNMVPQSPDNNQGPWAALEGDLRTLADAGNELYIVSGPAGVGGGSSNGNTVSTIADGHVTVPSATWKVVLVMPKADGDDVARVTCATRSIAVIMPNVQGIRGNDWHSYITTVDAVEQLTGYDFFSNVDPAVQACVEAGKYTDAANPPGASDGAYTTAEDTPVNVTLTALPNGSNAAVTYNVLSPPAHGTLTGTGANRVYTPEPNFNGNDSFTYSVTQGASTSRTATVSLLVTDVDDAPVAVNDATTVSEDSTANAIDVLANDTDVDGGPKSIAGVTQPANGTVSITGSGTGVSYTPNANSCNSVSGTPDTFTYTLNGGSTATVSVTVTCVDDDPTAVADAVTVAEDSGANAIDVLANDTDVDGGPKSIASVTQPANGTVVITGGGTGLTYAPGANYCNTPPGTALDTFTYTLSPGGSSTTVTVNVTCVNDNPVANNDTSTVAEDSVENIVSVLANDTDVDGDTLSVASVGAASNGTAVLDGGVVKYTPSANYNGPDAFSYVVSDGHGGTATATVSVTVNAVNDNPVAANDSATVAEDSGANTVNVLTNDSDVDGDTLSVSAVTQGAHGSVANNGGSVSYTPNANYNGADSFDYTVSDGHGGTATAIVSVNVESVNDNPTTTNDTATTDEDTAVSVDVVGNDNDIDGDMLSLESAGGATHGSVAVVSGQAVFTPEANYHGSASFTYVVSDGHGGTAEGSVTVTVKSVNDNPVAVADSATTNEDTAVTVNVLANDTDVDGDTLSVQSAGGATKGSVTFNASGVTYTPNANANGSDSFTYTISDGNGGTATATVSVNINAVNDAPSSPSVPGPVTIPELAAYTFTASASDVDGDALTFSLVGAPAGASISSSGVFNWTPTEAQGGTGVPFTFTVRVSDGTTYADSNVSITVTEVNSAPTLAPIANQVVMLGGTLTFTASGADTDLPAQTLVYSLTGAYPAGASINPATGAFSWTPAQAGQVYTFNVRVTDNGPGSLFAEQPVTVSAGYTWSGLLQPINQNGSSVFKLGRTVPVKFQLTGAGAGITNAVARLYVTKITNNVLGTEEAADSTSNATEGNLFRYADGQYIFNLSTNGLTVGTYQLRVDTGDGVLRVVNISLR